MGRVKEKRNNRDKRIGTGPAPVGGSCEGGKVSTHQEAPSWAETAGGRGRKLRSHGGERSHRGPEGKEERFLHRGAVPTSTHQPERLACLPAGAGGVGSWGSGFGRIAGRGLGLAAWTQPEGVSAPQLAGRESGKSSGAAEQARNFFLPLCFLAREERGFRAPPKRDPKTGVSCSYQRGPQRWAWDTKAAAAATKKPVCEHRSLSTPPLLGACAACYCQHPVSQGQLPRENARCASGCCNVMLVAVAVGLSRLLRTPPSPRPEWARAP